MKELLDKCDGQYRVELFSTAKEFAADDWKDYEVVITDYFALTKLPTNCFDSKVLIMDNGLGKETVVSLFLTEKIAGLIPVDAGLNTLLKAIQVVRNGEVWIDNPTVKCLLNRSITRNVKDSARITEREAAVIRLVKEGYKNKEIAHLLSISEQTVKSHLNRIFRKAHVSARTELIAHLSKVH
jgi:DNA-binding NarL/FixJ family response regulator